MRSDRTPLLLIEEAIQLLRTSPVLVYALYCAGTVPFLLAFFSFCAEMSYNRSARKQLRRVRNRDGFDLWLDERPPSVLLSGTHSCLRRQRNQMVETSHDAGNLEQQIALQPFGFFIKPLAWLLIFPVTYVSAFFQNLTILGGEGRERSSEKVGNSRASGQNKVTQCTVCCLFWL